MVECDEISGGAPVQHREVQGQESKLFLSYFGNHTKILEGGCVTGFKHVEASKADPRLYRLKGKGAHMQLTQMPCARSSLNGGDVFFLDVGKTVWMWIGSEANHFEKTKGADVGGDMASARH